MCVGSAGYVADSANDDCIIAASYDEKMPVVYDLSILL